MYPTVHPSHANPRARHVHVDWRQTPAERLAAMAREHSQLVQAVRTTDCISLEQAELQVTAFEQQFKDDGQ